MLAKHDGESRVRVFYTGGTIGMIKNEQGVLAPIPHMMEKRMLDYPDMHDVEFADSRTDECTCTAGDSHVLVMPLAEGQDKRVIYTISEYEPLLDSSNMGMADWERIAEDVKKYYDSYDGFVVMHGTDTLCYTASALSFMLENLGKPVVVTGAQISIFDTRSDARDNFLSSLIIAGNYPIPEVCVMFCRKLYRGNRTVKRSSEALEAFFSPNFPAIADMAYSVEFARHLVRPYPVETLNVHSALCPDVGLLRIFPSVTADTVRCFLAPPMRGAVFQTFGTGNAPCNRRDLTAAWAEAACRGVLIVNITQCLEGSVAELYETGSVLYECGAVGGYDMTPEAALCKLSYVLSKPEWNHETRKRMMSTDMRGELTAPPDPTPDCSAAGDIAEAAARILKRDTAEGIKHLRDVLHPALAQAAAFRGDVCALRALEKRGADVAGVRDPNVGRSALHVACTAGREQIVKHLIDKGADVNAEDKRGRRPLQDAVENGHKSIVRLLISVGACLPCTSATVVNAIMSAVEQESVDLLESYRRAGVDVGSVRDGTGRTPAHVSALHASCPVMDYLTEHGYGAQNVTDMLGMTPKDYALRSKQYKSCSCDDIIAPIIKFNADG